MTQEEKQLLLIDLCARLPHGVVIEITSDGGMVEASYDMKLDAELLADLLHSEDDFKPYLRPLESMTEEEKKIMSSYGFELIPYDTGYTGFANIENYIDEVSFRFMEEFLNSHHFDYRGLIPMGIAFEAPEGMYKTK